MGAETSINPIRPGIEVLNRAPRCGARTRSGGRCRQAAVKGKRRCRMHGGAKGSGAPEGERNGRWRHGQRSGAVLAERMMGRLLLWLAEGQARGLLESRT